MARKCARRKNAFLFKVTSVLIPEISEISTETLETGTEAVVKDTVIAVEALAETKVKFRQLF